MSENFNYTDPSACDAWTSIPTAQDPDGIIIARSGTTVVYAADEVIAWEHETLAAAVVEYLELVAAHTVSTEPSLRKRPGCGHSLCDEISDYCVIEEG